MASELRWIRSSYSSGGAEACVECASNGAAVWVRDSKDARRRFEVSLFSWLAFVTAVTRT
ncbi:DUF397 domain-containing protein [Lentzea sp. NEAU-D7]|uniref:DUF397 domain-containing protein n=1 Tax=Lentzea sp. NEAU-D7 TaxID=2994667 RepID=UPI00224A6176|nr:DUF397 domain-containing protein [Lentzea sp. NEAU-D7]MCX2953059.1 DUF397 domain-containing protein [Lentzea sp. NEAU-D7]